MFKLTTYCLGILLLTLYCSPVFSQANASDDEMIIIFNNSLSYNQIENLLLEEFNFEVVDGPTPVTGAYLTKPIIDGVFPAWAYLNATGPINGVIHGAKTNSNVNGAGLNYTTNNFGEQSAPQNGSPSTRPCEEANISLSVSLGINDREIAFFDTGIIQDHYFSTYLNMLNPFSYGLNFIEPGNAPLDDNNHGTQMASILANQLAVVSSSFGGIPVVTHPDNVDMNIFKTHNEIGVGTIWDKIQALDASIEANVEIINMSFSFSESYDYRFDHMAPFTIALNHAWDEGILCVAAVGNIGTDNDLVGGTAYYPASNLHDNILSVGASDCQGEILDFSNYGDQSVDILAPGLSIPGMNIDSEWDNISGTSPATALVASLATQLGTHQDDFDYVAVKCAILNGSTPNASLSDLVLCGGYINADEALVALSSSDPCHYVPVPSILSLRAKKETPATIEKSTISHRVYSGQLLLTIDSPKAQNIEIDIYNILGQRVVNQSRDLDFGETDLQLDLPHTNSLAVYFVQLLLDGEKSTFTVVR